MTGVKGRSGGARANSGGARPNAGRKPRPPSLIAVSVPHAEPAAFLKAVMNDSTADTKLRIDAAKALLSAQVRQERAASRKERTASAAKEAAAGKYSAARPPLKLIETSQQLTDTKEPFDIDEK